MTNVKDYLTLSNGVQMPLLGYGTMPTDWTKGYGPEFVDTLVQAIHTGYRNIDTAAIYGTEEYVGEAVKSCIADGTTTRKELFISTKVWNTDRGYDRTLRAFDRSMSALGLDVLDLYLIHTPAVAKWHSDWAEINLSTWRAMERLYHEGRIRAIGVSNFLPHHLQALTAEAEIVPMVNQIEVHPGFTSATTRDYCRQYGIAIEAWGPFGNGQVLQNKQLAEIAHAHHKCVAQVCLRWLIQQSICPLPKSNNPQRMAENRQIFDFSLTETEMSLISVLTDCGGFCVDADNAEE